MEGITKVHNPQIAKLDQLTNWLLAALLFIPFAISFGALRHLAESNGVSYPILYPLMIDGGLIIFKALALRASLRGELDRYAWSMAVTLTIISVALNIVHVPTNLPTLWLARFMAALPPLIILAAFVAVSRRIEETARRQTAVSSYTQLVHAIRAKKMELETLIRDRTAELDQLVSSRTAKLDALLQKIGQLETQHGRLTSEIDGLRQQKQTRQHEMRRDTNRSGKGKSDEHETERRPRPNASQQESLNRLLVYVSSHPYATLSDIGDAIGRSKSTAGKYAQSLMASGRLTKNGHGWEVVDGGGGSRR